MTLDRHSPIITPKIPVEDLTAEIDIHGNPIAVGTRVRSHSHPYVFEKGEVTGLGLNDVRTSYFEGVIIAIGARAFEGCRRYTIQVETAHHARGDRIEVEAIHEVGEDGQIFPPLNGTRSTSGGRCCGVVAIIDTP